MVAVALTAACVSDYELVPVPPAGIDFECGPGCLPAAVSSWVNAGMAARAGAAVEILAYGDDSSSLKDYRVVATGGPDHDSSAGIVYLRPADPDTGALTGSTVALPAPTGAPTRFGTALLGVDVHDGYVTYAGSPPQATAHAYGEELLVGAPGDGVQEKGKLYWYRPTTEQEVYEYGGGVTPVGVTDGAEFGAAIAAPHELDASYPSLTTTEVPEWIAVGAPGEDKVYVLAVDPARYASPRFSVVSPVLSGSSGTRFGASLAIGDFNGDGYRDLAVGIPDGAGGRGAVRLYPGQSGATPLDVASAFSIEYDDVAWPGSATDAESFGASMAAGFIFAEDPDVVGLVVGDPDWDGSYPVETDLGAVCQLHFASAWSYEDYCAKAPDSYPPGSRFGAAVAVGNYIAKNAMGSASAPCALAEEIAVGAPGYSGTYTEEGAVAVFGQDSDLGGVFISHYPPMTFTGGDDDVGLGAALASEFVQYDTVHEDLAMGAPGYDSDRGSFSLTRAEPTGAEGDLLSGTWQGVDSGGDPFDLQVSWTGTTLHLRMLDPARVRVTKPGGEICGALNEDADFSGYMTLPTVDWTTGGDVDGGPVDMAIPIQGAPDVYVDLWYEATDEEFELHFDYSQGTLAFLRALAGQGDCTVVGDPWEFSQVEAMSCE